MAAKLSGPGGGKFDVSLNNEINVTPFVDVMLVLLIIFMVCAPLANVTIKVKLPVANAKPAVKPPRIVYISIKENGNLYVGDNRTDIIDLPDSVKLAVGGTNPANERIYIRGDQNVEYGRFMEVMNALQDNGFYSVALVGEDRAGLRK
ncbi:MAG: ExbD/TolR family protein [Caulobacterales bacterium]